jgi:hypothetical protein
LQLLEVDKELLDLTAEDVVVEAPAAAATCAGFKQHS